MKKSIFILTCILSMSTLAFAGQQDEQFVLPSDGVMRFTPIHEFRKDALLQVLDSVVCRDSASNTYNLREEIREKSTTNNTFIHLRGVHSVIIANLPLTDSSTLNLTIKLENLNPWEISAAIETFQSTKLYQGSMKDLKLKTKTSQTEDLKCLLR